MDDSSETQARDPDSGQHASQIPASRHPAAPPEALPPPFERFEIAHPAVPPDLGGLSILHLCDLHIRRARPWTPTLRRVLDGLPSVPVDLVCLGGDYAEHPPDAPAAASVLAELAGAWRARLGAVGVFGNHDDGATRALLRASLPDVRWLDAETVPLPAPGAALAVVGASYPEDAFAAVASAAEPPTPATLRVGLAHHPAGAVAMTQLRVPIVLSAHTHGGQWRAGPSLAPHTSCDLPASLAWGVVRFDRSLVLTPRGLGTAALHLRVRCPPQAPLYVLRHGPLLGSGGRSAERLIAW